MNGTTTFVCGCEVSQPLPKPRGIYGPQACEKLVNLEEVNATLETADVAILVIGLNEGHHHEGSGDPNPNPNPNEGVTNHEGIDRAHNEAGYALPGMQDELVQLVAAANKTVVVILVSGNAVGIDYVAARTDWPLLVPGYGGRYAPEAISEAIFGDFSPSGRLPYTIYPELWGARTSMDDMALTAGDGRTYKWYKGSMPAPFSFGEGPNLVLYPCSLSLTLVVREVFLTRRGLTLFQERQKIAIA